MFDSTIIKKGFPIYDHHPELVYLDSAATALKPMVVIEAEMNYYEQYSSNISRGIYPLAEQATEAFEQARSSIARFLGATHPEEIIFTAGTTASLNLAATLLTTHITASDTLVVTATEHHSNLLPWKELAKRQGATLVIAPVTSDGFIDETVFAKLIDAHTKVVALPAVSNVLGIINPVKKLIALAREQNPAVTIIVDAAQAVGHFSLSVVDWDADFVAFSGHKLFGPTGIGVLYGKKALLESFPPVSFGGGMVLDACAKETLYKETPARFEAGTPHIAGAIGLGAAITFIETLGLDNIRQHEVALMEYALRRLQEVFGADLYIVGTTDPQKKSGILSFTLAGVHPHDVAYLLGERSICVRAGLQCAAPLHESLNLPATTRLSLSIYNTKDDIEQLITALQAIRTVF